MPELSIIIPALNEQKYLPKLIDSIKKQSFKDYEIIVADAGSKDRTVEIALKKGCTAIKGGLPSTGRNAGAGIAKGNILLFLDSDVILPRDFLKNAVAEFEHKYLDAATCEFIPISRLKIDREMHRLANEFLKSMQYIRPFAPGFCIMITKRLHKRIGGFNEKITLAEDHDYAERASKLGKFRVLEKPKIYVSVRRLEKEGRKNLALKYAKATFLVLMGKKLQNKDLNYELDYRK